MPVLMLLLNLIFLVPGYLVKWLFFTLNGYGRPWRAGMKEAFGLFKKLDKPKFRLKNLPNYILLEFWMIGNCFVYADYRIRRYLGRT